MTDCVTVTTVIDDQAAARRIARSVVEARLAACAQTSQTPVESTYWWQGALEEATEYVVTCKTTAALAEKLVAAIREAHTYDVPEVLVTPVLGGDPAYLAWVAEQTSRSTQSRR